jgi:hypothetical protein
MHSLSALTTLCFTIEDSPGCALTRFNDFGLHLRPQPPTPVVGTSRAFGEYRGGRAAGFTYVL